MSGYCGKIAQVIGPVVDVIFEGEGNNVPAIYTALKVKREDGSDLILEVEQHIGEDGQAPEGQYRHGGDGIGFWRHVITSLW